MGLLLPSLFSSQGVEISCNCMPARGEVDYGKEEKTIATERKVCKISEDKYEGDFDEDSSTFWATDEAKPNVSFIEGGLFWMGTSTKRFAIDGETPRRRVRVRSFYMDIFEVTNDEYGMFSRNTNYRTDSEVYEWSFVFHAAIPSRIKHGLEKAVLGAEWWLPVPGASWLEPEGPGTNVFATNRGLYPAVHISWNDADSFCKWRGGMHTVLLRSDGQVSVVGDNSQGQAAKDYPCLAGPDIEKS